MNRTQYFILLGSSLFLALLLVVRLVLMQNTQAANTEMVTKQKVLLQAQGAIPVLSAVRERIIRGMAEERDLSDLLRKYEIHPSEVKP
ncbi:MAG: hypothetical protein ACFCUX_00975 [Candidatus Methylacidiphilales bacterium]